jgi:hypothetical protein
MSRAFSRGRIAVVGSVLILFGVVCVNGAVAGTPADLTAVFPEKAIAFVEVSGLEAKLEQARNSDVLTAWLASPQYQRYTASNDYRRLQAVLEIAERQLGWDAWTTGKKLLGGKVAAAVYPKDGSKQPDVLLIVQTAEPTALRELRQQLDPILVLAEEQIKRTEALGGVETFTFPDDKAFVAWKDDWLAAATSRRLLDGVLEKLTGKPGDESAGGLAADAAYQLLAKSAHWSRPQSSGETTNDRILRAYVNTEQLKNAAGGKPIPDKLDNALASLLFGDVVEALRTSKFAAATIDVAAKGVSITAAMARDSNQSAAAHQAFVPADGRGVLPPPPVPNRIGAFTLYRDFAHWYAHREDLLQEQVLPGFDKFETGLANILPGRDFGEDVLPLIGRRITFVAAPQDYAHLDGEPGVKLPGMALIVELAKPEEAAPLFQLFFQTLAAILNLEAGQQGRQPWVVASEAYHDVQISYARYLQKPAGENLGIVYNFLPASARVGDQFILSSSLPLCKQLIDSFRDGPDGEADKQTDAAGPQTILAEVDFDSLAELIESDSDFFVGRMTQEGRTTDEARAEFGALVDMLGQLDKLKATTESRPDVFKIRLEGSWK